MSKRRLNGEGTFTQRPGGKGWQGKITYTDPATGQTKRASVSGPTAAAVKAKAKEVRERLEEGLPPKDGTQSVAAWLKQWKTTTLQVSKRAESTKALYTSLSASHLEPAPFGDITLDKLKPMDIEALILALRSKTKPGKGEGADPVRACSDSTIRTVFTILGAALDCAVRDGHLARNPAARVERPGVARVEAKHLPAGDVTAVLKAAEGSRYHTALVLIATTGLRRGECLALHWSDINLDAGVLNVRGTLGRIGNRLVISEPKTARSRREVPLHATTVAMLRKHRLAQMEERMAAANVWTDEGLVFTTPTGGKVDPRNFLRVIETAAKTAKVDGVGVHTLRHSAATMWLESGTHIKQVADLLGHSSTSITGDIYGHGSDDGARQAVDKLGEQLGL